MGCSLLGFCQTELFKQNLCGNERVCIGRQFLSRKCIKKHSKPGKDRGRNLSQICTSELFHHLKFSSSRDQGSAGIILRFFWLVTHWSLHAQAETYNLGRILPANGSNTDLVFLHDNAKRIGLSHRCEHGWPSELQSHKGHGTRQESSDASLTTNVLYMHIKSKILCPKIKMYGRCLASFTSVETDLLPGSKGHRGINSSWLIKGSQRCPKWSHLPSMTILWGINRSHNCRGGSSPCELLEIWPYYLVQDGEEANANEDLPRPCFQKGKARAKIHGSTVKQCLLDVKEKFMLLAVSKMGLEQQDNGDGIYTTPPMYLSSFGPVNLSNSFYFRGC